MTSLRLVLAAAGWVIAACAPASASGTVTYADYLARKDTETMKAFVEGAMDAFLWSNAYNGSNDLARPYCQPANVGLSGENGAAILESYLLSNPPADTTPVGLLLLQALQDRFPC